MSAANDHTNQKPVIFLAFANDREKYLYNLKLEQRGIREALRSAEEAGLCEVVYENNTTIGDILDVFQKHRDRIVIFHYGGHADDYLLLLESDAGECAPAHSGGRVSFLARQKGLQLVFINGCCSKRQALDLLKAGVPAVIGTSQPIDDAAATDLSERFYKGLARGTPIDRAWAEAVDQIKIQQGDAGFRHLTSPGKAQGVAAFQWDIYYRDGAEKVKEWNLPAAANNPLFGLPEISPDYYRKLPHKPFIGLQHFKKEEAAIFFGRSAQIRKLYNYITGIHPIILFYGESGVGKSSLLDAGLLPRLENDYTVQYLRRDAKKGLTSTVTPGLAKHSRRAGTTGCKQSGSQPDVRNLVPNRSHDRPSIDRHYAEVFLQQLDRNGIIEAVEGLTKHPATRENYRLEIEKSAEGNLAEIIADDLLADKKSPIAPVLQLVLTKLWDTAVQENSETPRFTVAHYQQLQKEGIAMDDFLQQQMEQLREWQPEVVQSGLVLDVLHAHTTALGTAGTCAMDELGRNYNHHQDILDALIVKCQSLYLLTRMQQNQKLYSRLAHDLLAPVVRSAYHNSDKPGQRAARILSSKLTDFKGGEKNVWLYKAELVVMKKGKNGMRRLTDPEQKLLIISQKRERRYRMRMYALFAILLMLVSFGYWAFNEKTKQEELLKYSDDAVKQRLQELGYYDKIMNPNGKGIVHQYQLQKDSLVVYDGATKLYWQRSGSEKALLYDDALAYIDSLNRVKFADYIDWRLPTLEEAMSLMEPEQKNVGLFNVGLFIDPVFDSEQIWIWTASKQSAGRAWFVNFLAGHCDHLGVGGIYVRAVRSGQ